MVLDSRIDADAVLASDSVVDLTFLFFVDSVVGSTEFQVPDSEPDSTAAIVLKSVAGAIAVVDIHSFNGSTTVQVLLRLSARFNCRGGLKLGGWLNSRSRHLAIVSMVVQVLDSVLGEAAAVLSNSVNGATAVIAVDSVVRSTVLRSLTRGLTKMP